MKKINLFIFVLLGSMTYFAGNFAVDIPEYEPGGGAEFLKGLTEQKDEPLEQKPEERYETEGLLKRIDEAEEARKAKEEEQKRPLSERKGEGKSWKNYLKDKFAQSMPPSLPFVGSEGRILQVDYNKFKENVLDEIVEPEGRTYIERELLPEGEIEAKLEFLRENVAEYVVKGNVENFESAGGYKYLMETYLKVLEQHSDILDVNFFKEVATFLEMEIKDSFSLFEEKSSPWSRRAFMGFKEALKENEKFQNAVVEELNSDITKFKSDLDSNGQYSEDEILSKINGVMQKRIVEIFSLDLPRDPVEMYKNIIKKIPDRSLEDEIDFLLGKRRIFARKGFLFEKNIFYEQMFSAEQRAEILKDLASRIADNLNVSGIGDIRGSKEFKILGRLSRRVDSLKKQFGENYKNIREELDNSLLSMINKSLQLLNKDNDEIYKIMAEKIYEFTRGEVGRIWYLLGRRGRQAEYIKKLKEEIALVSIDAEFEKLRGEQRNLENSGFKNLGINIKKIVKKARGAGVSQEIYLKRLIDNYERLLKDFAFSCGKENIRKFQDALRTVYKDLLKITKGTIKSLGSMHKNIRGSIPVSIWSFEEEIDFLVGNKTTPEQENVLTVIFGESIAKVRIFSIAQMEEILNGLTKRITDSFKVSSMKDVKKSKSFENLTALYKRFRLFKDFMFKKSMLKEKYKKIRDQMFEGLLDMVDKIFQLKNIVEDEKLDFAVEKIYEFAKEEREERGEFFIKRIFYILEMEVVKDEEYIKDLKDKAIEFIIVKEFKEVELKGIENLEFKDFFEELVERLESLELGVEDEFGYFTFSDNPPDSFLEAYVKLFGDYASSLFSGAVDAVDIAEAVEIIFRVQLLFLRNFSIDYAIFNQKLAEYFSEKSITTAAEENVSVSSKIVEGIKNWFSAYSNFRTPEILLRFPVEYVKTLLAILLSDLGEGPVDKIISEQIARSINLTGILILNRSKIGERALDADPEFASAAEENFENVMDLMMDKIKSLSSKVENFNINATLEKTINGSSFNDVQKKEISEEILDRWK